MIYPATKTLAAIEEAIKADQGATYRGWLEKTIPAMGDAYSTDKFPFRSHLGASGIGDECARKPWLSFRWFARPKHSGRLLRLFNRGHLEEARFIAMLLTIGCEVYQQDENGNQFRISDAGGHFGGSGDGVAIGVPDLPPGTPALLEFKTSADSPFRKLVENGVRAAKFEHYVQMNTYMRKMGLPVALYMSVNKNNDELYGEIVPFDADCADTFIERGVNLVWKQTPPNPISTSAGYWKCKMCDFKAHCHLDAAPDQNCRTCIHARPTDQSEIKEEHKKLPGKPRWVCAHNISIWDKHSQLGAATACGKYEPIQLIAKG